MTSSILTVVLLAGALAVPAFAQTIASGDSAAPTAMAPTKEGSGVKPETIIGRVTSLNTKAGTFAVRAADGEIVNLKARTNVSVNSLRRGERVIVTYSQGVALKVKATRNIK